MTAVLLETSAGNITIEFFAAESPTTVANFIGYVEDAFFDGTIFHRVIPGFVIQGGGFTPEMHKKSTKPPIQNEAANGIKNRRGTLSMARTSDPHSATSQFFINLVDNASLDHAPGRDGYAVFAKVTDGMDVVDQIATAKTGTHGAHADVPLTPVVVHSARTLEA